jgi:hypothetical protein
MMEIRITKDKPITAEELSELSREWHGTMVKCVADIERGVIALGGEWHMDANVRILTDGSQQRDVWGFNIYPKKRGDAAIEYISLINVRPAQGNRNMEIADQTIRNRIRTLTARFIPFLDL